MERRLSCLVMGKFKNLPYLHLHTVAKVPYHFRRYVWKVWYWLPYCRSSPSRLHPQENCRLWRHRMDDWQPAPSPFFMTKLSLVINSPSPLPFAAPSFRLNAQLPISYQLFLIKTTHKFPSRNLRGKRGNPFIHNRISCVNCLNHTWLAVL